MNNILNRILIEWNDSDLEDGIIKSSDVKNRLKIPDIEDLEVLIEGLMEISPEGDHTYYKPITVSLLKKLFEMFNISWELNVFPKYSKFKQDYLIGKEIIPKISTGKIEYQIFPIDPESKKAMHIYTPFVNEIEDNFLIIGYVTDPESYILRYNLYYRTWTNYKTYTNKYGWHYDSDKQNITALAKYIHTLLEEIANNYE